MTTTQITFTATAGDIEEGDVVVRSGKSLGTMINNGIQAYGTKTRLMNFTGGWVRMARTTKVTITRTEA